MHSIDTRRHTLHLVSAGKQPLRLAVSASLLLALSACANLHTIHRTTDLPGDGMAVHLDAAQRVIHVTKDGKACSEPTPDALQSYASSFGGTLSAGADSAAISNALRANAASVGLHSQSITLMRQHLFNICEYAQNDWLSDADVVLLMERSQDLTLGILAIEQLTGAVVARQPVLEDDTDMAAEAQRRLKASQDALATQAQLDLAIKKEQTLQANANAAAQVKPAALSTSGNDVVMLKTAQEGASSASATDGNAGRAEANRALAQAHTERAALEEELAGKLVQSQSGANGKTGVLDPQRASTINAGTAEHLARASTDIVRMILNKGHLTDMCITFINHPKKYVEMWPQYKEIMAQCKSVLTADLRTDTTQPYSYVMPGLKDKLQPKPDQENWAPIVTPAKREPDGSKVPQENEPAREEGRPAQTSRMLQPSIGE